jgi:hypothetical protein
MKNIPAFPTGTGVTPYNPGMTLRDYFAAKAMQGELASQHPDGGSWHDVNKMAAYAYSVADAMLKARENT